MRVALASEAQEEAGALVAELKAIEQWDAAYWRNPSPQTYETLAFVARSKRRCEILSQLLSVLPATAQQGEQELWKVKKLRSEQEGKNGVTHGLGGKPK